MAFDASPATTHNPATGNTPTAAWGDIHNENAAVLGGAWTAYTPSWTTSGTAPAIGNGTLTGAYRQIGKTLDVRIHLVAGSTTTFGTGEFRFSLPASLSAASSVRQVLSCRLLDGSTSYSAVGVAQASTAYLIAYANGATSAIDSGSITWGANDELTFTGTIEVT